VAEGCGGEREIKALVGQNLAGLVSDTVAGVEGGEAE
jgi:hypothetical protein